MDDPHVTPLISNETIILVNGTFAEDAPWIQAHSDFTAILRSEFPDAQLVKFSWSGGNSFLARFLAGRDLRKLIRTLSSKIHLVGHSHGGNVILYALRDRKINDKVSSCVFMGTPFFDVRQRPFLWRVQLSLRSAKAWATIFAILMAGLFCTVVVTEIKPILVALFTVLPSLVPLLAEHSLMIPILYMALSIGVYWLSFRGFSAGLEYIGSEYWSKRLARLHRASIMSKWLLNYPEPSGRALVLYARKDEALSILNITGALTSILFNLQELVLKSFGWFVGAWVIIGLVAKIMPQLLPLDVQRLTFAYILVSVPSFLILVFGATLGTVWAYFWQSKIFGYGKFPHKSVNSMLVISSRRTPLEWNKKRHSILRVQPRNKGLIHSGFYSDPDIGSYIAKWLKINIPIVEVVDTPRHQPALPYSERASGFLIALFFTICVLMYGLS